MRELQNAIQHAVAMTLTTTITVRDLPTRVTRQKDGDKYAAKSLRAHLMIAEKRALEDAMNQANGNIAEAARRLNTDRSNLYKKLRCHGVIHQAD